MVGMLVGVMSRVQLERNRWGGLGYEYVVCKLDLSASHLDSIQDTEATDIPLVRDNDMLCSPTRHYTQMDTGGSSIQTVT